jgi:aspartyl-tRNA(Asn)/glutamyl-tRNA(Gln) amidotransferase subunit C
MKIDKELILKLEKLSRLSLDDDDRKIIAKDLEHILDMVNKIKELDTEGIEPLRHMTSQHIMPREDQPEVFENTEQLIDQSPKHKGSFITIPKVVDKKKS